MLCNRTLAVKSRRNAQQHLGKVSKGENNGSRFWPARDLFISRGGYFGPDGLCAPCVIACPMRSLAIVFTNFQSFSLSLFLSLSLSLSLSYSSCSFFSPLQVPLSRDQKSLAFPVSATSVSKNLSPSVKIQFCFVRFVRFVLVSFY